jgi:hypothetical protein
MGQDDATRPGACVSDARAARRFSGRLVQNASDNDYYRQMSETRPR